MIPSFYDSIEISRDGMRAKFAQRAQRWNVLLAFVLTFLEALATLLMLRFVWRLLRRGLQRVAGGRAPAAA